MTSSALLYARSLRPEGFRNRLGNAWSTEVIRPSPLPASVSRSFEGDHLGKLHHAVALPGMLESLVSGDPPADLEDVIQSWSVCRGASGGPAGDTCLRIADAGWILYYHGETATRSSELILSCGFDSAFRTSLRGQHEVIALILHPWAGVGLAGESASCFAGKRFPISEAFAWAGDLKRRLDEIRSLPESLRCIFDSLRSRSNRTRQQRIALSRDVIRSFDVANGRPGLLGIARSMGISLRTLERQVLDCTGLSPKKVERLRRMRKILPHCMSTRNADWISVALDHGFSDQSHLTNEFKRVYGFSPDRFRRLVAGRGFWTGGYVLMPVDLNAEYTDDS